MFTKNIHRKFGNHIYMVISVDLLLKVKVYKSKFIINTNSV